MPIIYEIANHVHMRLMSSLSLLLCTVVNTEASKLHNNGPRFRFSVGLLFLDTKTCTLPTRLSIKPLSDAAICSIKPTPTYLCLLSFRGNILITDTHVLDCQNDLFNPCLSPSWNFTPQCRHCDYSLLSLMQLLIVNRIPLSGSSAYPQLIHNFE